jgi:hypothetical protein
MGELIFGIGATDWMPWGDLDGGSANHGAHGTQRRELQTVILSDVQSMTISAARSGDGAPLLPPNLLRVDGINLRLGE